MVPHADHVIVLFTDVALGTGGLGHDFGIRVRDPVNTHRENPSKVRPPILIPSKKRGYHSLGAFPIPLELPVMEGAAQTLAHHFPPHP